MKSFLNARMLKDKKLVDHAAVSGSSYSNVLMICAAVGITLIGLYYHFLYLYPLPNPVYTGSSSYGDSTVDVNNNSSSSKSANSLIQIPKIIHQMWKDNYETIPYDLKRWRSGCQQVNHNYQFNMYYDEELKQFVVNNYPEYLELFNSLKGVFMADMARILYVYHYGGIYMDLDFYCVKNFDCMIQNIEKSYDVTILQQERLHHHHPSHVLIVPNEPYLQSIMLYLNNRTIIQDYFAATPKHPFLKWILDERNTFFHSIRAMDATAKETSSKTTTTTTTTTTTATTAAAAARGNNNQLTFSKYFPSYNELPSHLQYYFNSRKPFSHHFDQDLDRYYYLMAASIKKIKVLASSNTNTNSHNSSSSNNKAIHKLAKAALHPHMRIDRLLKTDQQLRVSAASAASAATPSISTSGPAFDSTTVPVSISSKHLRKNKINLQLSMNTSRHHQQQQSTTNSSRKLQNHISHSHIATAITGAASAAVASSQPMPRSGYVIEVSEKELHALVDGNNWRLSSFCVAVDYIYNDRKSQGFDCIKNEYVSYVNRINSRHSASASAIASTSASTSTSSSSAVVNTAIDLEKYSTILLKDQNKVDVIKFIHKQHILHHNIHTSAITADEHKADLPKLCSWYENKNFYHPDKDTVAVHVWSHVYFNILGWNYFRNYFNKPVYTHVESTSPATLSC